MSTLGRILVPVDFSPCSRAALDYAVFLSERIGATIDVLHVWEPPQHAAPEMFVLWHQDSHLTLSEFAESEAAQEMDRFLSSVERKMLRARGRLEVGEPVSTILRCATDGEYDLIVMGTHGRTGLAHLISGSVAERVVRRAPCPVTTVRLPDREAERTVEGALP